MTVDLAKCISIQDNKMRDILTFLMLIPLCTFAEEVEVVGQFVVAPISSEKCEASAITAPTAELSIDSELFNMLTFGINENAEATGIKNVDFSEKTKEDIKAIYSLEGQKQTSLKQGVNIIVDKQGNRKKVLCK